MRADKIWRDVLAERRCPTVLLDLGAAGGPPEAWAGIAGSCTYLGFEPDRRSQGDARPTGFKATHLVAAAVTHLDQPTVQLFLTRSRFCSSTLAPARDALRGLAFASLFDVEATTVVPATTIDRALRSRGLSHVDWFKADTQGTDLRLFASMSEEVRASVMAVDIEPGLIDAYEAEDLFSEAHEYFTASGFWLSSLRLGTNAKGTPETLGRMLGQREANADDIPLEYRRTPVCCEARYLRTLVPGRWHRDNLMALATFAAMDNQPVFAYEAIEAIPVDQRSGAIDRLAEWCVHAVRRTTATAPPGLWSRAGNRLRRALSK